MPLGLTDDEQTFEVTDAALGVAGGDPNTVYVLRPLLKEAGDAIVEKARKKEWDKDARAFVHRLNQQERDLALLDAVLVDWRGVTFRGAPVPCTLEFKRRLDPFRQQIIVGRASQNQITPEAQAAAEEAAKADSFRAPA